MASSANPPIHVAIGASSLGSVLVAASDRGICSILLGADREVLLRDLKDRFPEARLVEDPSLDHLMAKVVDLIETPAQTFDLPLDPRGTDFEMRVWQALREIPAGSTASYSEIAQRIGAPKEAYAVGEACAANMIAVAIPCHRVVRKDGTLAGYRWGFTRKRALLEREKASFATRSGKPPYRILSIRKAVVALAAVLMASALPAAAQQSRAETDSPLAEIRTTLRAFYFNLAHQDWEALAADILSAKVVAHRPAPEAMVAAASRSAPAAGEELACPSNAAPLVDQAAITLDGDWAEVSVPRCAVAAGAADEFRLIRFEARWRVVYIDLSREPDPVQLAR